MTIIQVAKQAGVSKSTVSRVLNGHQTVDPAMARRVRAAMVEVGFVPKANRRGPKPTPAEVAGFKTGVIGLLLVGRTHELLSLPYMARSLSGISETVQAAGRNLMIIEMPEFSDIPQIIRDRWVDGLVVTGTNISQPLVDALHPTPCVWLGGSELVLEITDHIVPNNRAAGVLAARYLRDRGCTRLAYVNDVPTHSEFPARLDAFCKELADVQVERFETSTREPEKDLWEPERMQAKLDSLVRRIVGNKKTPDGFFLPTDQQAAIFRGLMTSRGLVPEKDFYTVSCNNDEPWLAAMLPRSATIDLRPLTQGQLVARQLMRRIENPAEGITTIKVRPELVLPPEIIITSQAV